MLYMGFELMSSTTAPNTACMVRHCYQLRHQTKPKKGVQVAYNAVHAVYSNLWLLSNLKDYLSTEHRVQFYKTYILKFMVIIEGLFIH